MIGLIGLLAMTARSPAVAADDTVELPGGGLSFVLDERVVVEAQEIVLARGGVRATYVVRNRSEQAISRIVSWPMPDIDMGALGEDVVVLASPEPKNFANASVTVDGAPVSLAFEQRATAFSRDVTAVLEAAGLPLNPVTPDIEASLARVPPEKLGELEERGAIRNEDPRLLPNWSVRTTAFWRHTFEPGKPVTIGLSYVPVTASGLWAPESLAELKDAYCIDAGLEAAIAARLAKAERGLVTHRMTYAVAGDPGWWAPTPQFRLAIEKSGFETLVATCQRDLRVVGPTLLEWVGREHRPTDDIRVLFIN